jgi:hypothetical protein
MVSISNVVTVIDKNEGRGGWVIIKSATIPISSLLQELVPLSLKELTALNLEVM